MPKIHTLPETLIAKIAAGEVIERPAYAVKELIENAIDAGADAITIHIEESGLKKITVIDNGEGMERTDLEISFRPHTTSKLLSEDMLHSIASLGFRGEALASIAAISTLTIKSRVIDSPGGTLIEVKNGDIMEVSSIGTPIGTTIIVEDLYSEVPARKKFLKSSQTEFRHITDIVSYFALSYPTIHFHLTHNKKTVFDLPKKSALTDRIQMLLGKTIYDQLLPLAFEDGYITGYGYLGKPHLATGSSQRQYIYINNRKVSDRLISLAVKEAYGTLLPSAQLPTFLIFLTLPFEIVDVNVHPRKEQVSLTNGKAIFDAIKLAVTETLSRHNLTISRVPWLSDINIRKSETQSLAGQALRESVLPWNRGETDSVQTKTFMQIHQTYILALTEKGFTLIDQHAAHERILYEAFRMTYENKKNEKKSYTLPKPVTLTLSLTDSQILEEYMEHFPAIGFEIEHFQGNSFIIRKSPVVFTGRNLQKIIIDMLSDFSEDRSPKSVDSVTQKMLAFLSCRASVKSGDVLTEKYMKKIVNELTTTPNNTTCPHGRPTRLNVPLNDLHKFFKRK